MSRFNNLNNLNTLNYSPSRYNDVIYRTEASASLDLNFARNKSLIDSISGNNLVTFTRASSATFVDSQGVIRRAVTNLLLQSEDFSTTWTPARVSVSTNVIVAPNGTVTADTLTGDGTADFPQGVSQATTAFSTAGTKTISIYAKAGTNSFLQIYAGGNVNVFANFDLTAGSVGSVGTQSTAAIIPAGNGWYRCVLSTSQTNPTNVAIILVNSSTAVRAEVAGTSNSFHLWGAQLEQSSTVGEYIPTTTTINSAPRFDHNPVTKESLGLLVEESRTNLFLRSEEFDTTWSASNASVSANETIAPDNNTTADKLVCGTGTPLFQRITQLITATASATRFSVYVKAAEINQVELRSFSPTDLAIFDLSTQQVLFQSGSPAPTITDAGNGWYRCSITSSNSGVTSFSISLASGGSRTFTPISGAGIYLWGAQLEAGAFPTSYIPTTTTTVTRSVDVASITGTNFSSWYNQSEGTVFADFDSAMPDSGNVIFPWTLYEASTDYIACRTATGYSPDRLFFVSRVANSNEFTSESNSSGYVNMPISRAKGSFAFAVNNFGVSWNGGSSFGSASGALPLAISKLDIGSLNGSSILNGHIRRFTYFPTRLSNITLENITK